MLPNLSSITSAAAKGADLGGGADMLEKAKKAIADIGRDATGIKVLESAGKALKDIFKALGDTFNSTSSIGQATDSIKRAFGSVGSVFGSLGKTLGAVALAAGAAGGALMAVGEVLAGFVKKANPVVFEQFKLVVDDLMAVIGQAVVPIFKSVVIPVVRLFADTLMNLAPIGKAVAAALQPFVKVLGVLFELLGEELAKVAEFADQMVPAFEAVGEAFLAVVEAIRPVYTLLIDLIGGAFVEAAKALAEGLKQAVPYVVAVTRVVGDMVQQFTRWVREVLGLIGLDLTEKPKGIGLGSEFGKPSSTGAAVRQVGHSSIEDVVKQAQRAAFSLGSASANDPPSRTASASEAIKAKADEIYGLIKDMPGLIWEKVKELPDLIADALSKQAARVPGKIDSALGLKDGATGAAVIGAGTDALRNGPIVAAANAFSDFYQRNAPDILPSTPSWLKKK